MTEEFIMGYIPKRLKQLGYETYHIRHRDYSVQAGSSFTIDAYNELYFIIGSPDDLTIDSDYGMYDSTGSFTGENMHQHKGFITITNPTDSNKRVEFIQVIIVN
jgi:hypothetical protein